MNILIGTKNIYKAGVMEYILKGIENVNIHFLKDTDINVDVDEDQDSLKGNAEKKAVEISKFTDMYVLTSDGGVDIPGLGDKWDILRNQRIVGHDKEDSEKVKFILDLMDGLKGEDRKAEYHLALSLALNGQSIGNCEGITDRGYVVEDLPSGDIPLGMWFSHIWFCPEFGKTLLQLDEEEHHVAMRWNDGLRSELVEVINKIR